MCLCVPELCHIPADSEGRVQWSARASQRWWPHGVRPQCTGCGGCSGDQGPGGGPGASQNMEGQVYAALLHITGPPGLVLAVTNSIFLLFDLKEPGIMLLVSTQKHMFKRGRT